MEKQRELWQGYDRPSAEEAFMRCKAAAEALTSEQLEGRQMLHDVVVVLDVVWSFLQHAKEDVDTLTKMPSVESKMLEELLELRLAYWHASLEASMSQHGAKQKRTQELAQQLRPIRRRLFGGIDVVWPDDKEMQERLTKLRQGQGHADLANDVVALVGLYRPRLDEASAYLQRAPLEALLEEGGRLAPLLQESRKEKPETTEDENTVEMQRRLFVLLEDLYNEIAAAGAYAFRRQSQRAALYTPTLRTAYTRALPPSEPSTTPPK